MRVVIDFKVTILLKIDDIVHLKKFLLCLKLSIHLHSRNEFPVIRVGIPHK